MIFWAVSPHGFGPPYVVEKTMAARPSLLVIDNNPISEKILQKTFAEQANLNFATSVHEASEIIACDPVSAVIINADTQTINAAATCAWLKGEPKSSQLKLIVLTDNYDAEREFRYYESGADDVILMPCPRELLQHKVLRHTLSGLDNNSLYLASCTLNSFYENTYSSQSLSHCMTECLAALQTMGLKAALHVCDHPELTCSSFGQVNDYEKALLSYAECVHPTEGSARLTFGDDTMAILVQNLPNQYHPFYGSLVDWVKKIFGALSSKAQELLSREAETKHDRQDKKQATDEIPPARDGAQRLHYFVERALFTMEKSCEQEISRSIGRVEEVSTWRLSLPQKTHIAQLKDNLQELRETLLTNCMEIESRYLQFITERRAKNRLNLGW